LGQAFYGLWNGLMTPEWDLDVSLCSPSGLYWISAKELKIDGSNGIKANVPDSGAIQSLALLFESRIVETVRHGILSDVLVCPAFLWGLTGGCRTLRVLVGYCKGDLGRWERQGAPCAPVGVLETGQPQCFASGLHVQ